MNIGFAHACSRCIDKVDYYFRCWRGEKWPVNKNCAESVMRSDEGIWIHVLSIFRRVLFDFFYFV